MLLGYTQQSSSLVLPLTYLGLQYITYVLLFGTGSTGQTSCMVCAAYCARLGKDAPTVFTRSVCGENGTQDKVVCLACVL